MASIDLNDPAAARVLRAYERGRWRHALTGFAPVLLLPMLVLCIDGISLRTIALGALLFGTGVFVLWRGRDAARSVLPGVLAGTVPLVAAICAPRMHVCTGSSCMSFCLAACAGGGFLAGVVVGLVWRRSRRGRVSLAIAAVLSTMTGALGCSCVGYGGVLGMAAGFMLGMLPWVARAAPD
jgi:hypothetical protein